MIPLESSWCKGYMMIQTTDEDISNVIRSGNTSLPSKINNESLDVNQLLNEITNVIWGRIKSQFFTEEHNADVGGSSIQVPILVNHAKKFISFGATEPQLCFTYTVEDTQNRYKPFTLNQKIIFNLSWMPENMNISEQILSDSVESGELELF
nr:chemotaxis protein CheX [Marinibactrum halimedae]